MNVLLVSLLKREVTPASTAARTQIIYQLGTGLIQAGHTVTFLGTGDSYIPGAKVIPVISKAFIHMTGFENPFYAETAYLTAMAKKLEEIGNNFDVIHNHAYPEFINLLVIDRIQRPFVTTIHAQATPELDMVLSLFLGTSFVSISDAHKKGFRQTKIKNRVYNGVDTSFFVSREKSSRDYLLFVGRMSKAKDAHGKFIDPKGVTNAIMAAQQANMSLKIVGNVEDRRFYEKLIAPHLSSKIEFVGEVSAEQSLTKKDMRELYQKAKAFLFPINWDEPFGLVMAEAMSCGIPVIAYKRGSVPELVVDGKTGFVVDSYKGVEGLVEAIRQVDSLDSNDCRQHVIANFSLEKMVENYEKIYKELVSQS